MKKIIFISFLLLANVCYSQITSFSAEFQNNTNYEFKITENINHNCSKCLLCWGEKFFISGNGDVIKPHALSEGIYNTYSGCGVSGELKIECTAKGQKYIGKLFYNIPFVGADVFFYVIDAPFRLSTMSHDERYNIYYMQIDGGPDEVTNTIVLPENGNHSYQYIITAKPNGPVFPNNVSLSDVLDIKITAPTTFEEKLTGSYTYLGKKGLYSGAHSVGKTTYYNLPILPNGDKQVKVVISNLPENVPLTPSVNMLTGIDFPLPNPLPAEASLPCGSSMSKYNIWLNKISDDNYSLQAGYLCSSNNSQNSNSPYSQRYLNLRKQMEINPTDWNNKNAIIFQKSSNLAVKASTLKINQQIKNVNKINRQ